MKLLVSTFVILVLSQTLAEKVKFDNHKLYRLVPKDVNALKALKDLEDVEFSGYNFWTSPRAVGHSVDVLVPPTHVKEIENMIDSLGLDAKVMMDNVQELIDNEGLRPESRAGTFDWTSYHTFDEYNTFLATIAAQYPGVVTLFLAGVSYEGRQILGVRLSFSRANENNAVFVESGIHAREWITGAVSTYIINAFLTSSDAAVGHLAASYDWYFVPIFNPDGFVYTHTTNRMWRKTRVQYSLLCYGADPNRNWGYYWNTGGSSGTACSDTYRGPAPFSEPSTESIARFITTIADKLVGYISFHSYSQMLLIPYGYTSAHLENYNETVSKCLSDHIDEYLDMTTWPKANPECTGFAGPILPILAIGLKAAESLARRYGTRYAVGNIVETIYVASGGSMDWVKGIYKTPIAYTYELRDTGTNGFVLPAAQIIPTSLETLDSLVTIFDEYEKIRATKN